MELGEGLSLRPLLESDAGLIFSVVEANREHLRRFLPWVDPTRSISDTLAYIRDQHRRREAADSLAYTIWLRNDFCGVIGVHRIDLTNSKMEIGYWLKEAAQGRGLMTRACQAVIRMGFSQLAMERIEIRVAPANTRSLAIPARLGFTYEGTLRHAQLVNGRFLDLQIYSLLAHEYNV